MQSAIAYCNLPDGNFGGSTLPSTPPEKSYPRTSSELWDSGPVGYIALDAFGDIVGASLTAAELLATDPGCLPGKPFRHFVAPHDAPLLLDHVSRCCRGERRVVTEVILNPPRQPSRHVELLTLGVDEREHTIFRTALIDISERKRAEQKLLELNRHLEERVAERTHELEKLNCALRESEDRFRRMINTAAEGEMLRIGRDLHDGLGQHLGSLHYLADSLARNLRQSGSAQAGQAKELCGLIVQAVAQTRNLAHGLCGVPDAPDGLTVAFEDLARYIREHQHIDCSFRYDPGLLVLENDLATHLYRITQEAISNAVKHGRATRIGIFLSNGGGTLRLRIRDNGTGLPENPRRNGLGLRSMQQRAALAGGELKVRNEPGGGAEVLFLHHASRADGEPRSVSDVHHPS